MLAPSPWLIAAGLALFALPIAWLVNCLADWYGRRDGPAESSEAVDRSRRAVPVAIDLSRFPRVGRYRARAVVILLTGSYGALAFGLGWDWRLVPGLLYVTLFLLIAVVDLERRIIPNSFVWIGSFAALGFSLVPTHPVPFLFAVTGGLGGFLIFGLIYLLGRLLARSGRDAAVSPVGLGDVKLAVMLGFITGFPAVVGAIFVGAFIGGLVIAALLAIGVVSRKTYVPYGPFLLAGAGWMYFFALRGYLS